MPHHLSRRDEFAKAAMATLMHSDWNNAIIEASKEHGVSPIQVKAETSVEHADALIIALDSTPDSSSKL